MTIITRDNVRIPLRTVLPVEVSGVGQDQIIHKTHVGTLAWDTENRKLELVHPESGEALILLSGSSAGLNRHEVRILDVRAANRAEGIAPRMDGALSALRTLGVSRSCRSDSQRATSTIVELYPDLGVAAQEASTRTATVTLFKGSGKYYTQEAWAVLVNAIFPSAMQMSPDFRRIDGGAVLVDAVAVPQHAGAHNWGFPQLFPAELEHA